MATFYNQATLNYNGLSTTSNTVTGELVTVLQSTKTAVNQTYTPGDNVTYVINLINSGSTALTNLTLTDNLGSYTYNSQTVVPLTYNTGTLQYYTNGTLQATPTISNTSPLTVTGISIPANGNATIIYQARVNSFATPTNGGTVVNTATISGGGLAENVTATETITAGTEPALTISKSVSPTTVNENGTLTYTFLIQNTGNSAADASDAVTLTDTFNPILSNLSVTFNGNAWTSPTNYTYNASTGEFQTVSGQITVPAATYTQNTTTGEWEINPGISTLVVTGTV